MSVEGSATGKSIKATVTQGATVEASAGMPVIRYVKDSDLYTAIDGYMDGHPEIPAPTTASVGQTIRVTAVDEGGKPTAWETADLPEQAQADWNQNDSTAADYVKNRPFYTGDLVEQELFDVVSLMDAAGYQWQNSDDYKVCGFMFDQLLCFDTPLVIGDKYKILYNGEVNECPTHDGAEVGIQGAIVIGDLYGIDSVNTRFLIVCAPYAMIDESDTSGRWFIYLAADYTGTVPTELKVISHKQEIVKIEEKFIPDELKGNFALSVNGITADKSRNINITPSDIGASKTIIITETGGTTDISMDEVLNFLDMGYSVILKSTSKSGKLFTLSLASRMSGLRFVNADVQSEVYGFLVITALLSGNSVKFNVFDYQNNYIYLKSSTENSGKHFKITVDDSGTLTATEDT